MWENSIQQRRIEDHKHAALVSSIITTYSICASHKMNEVTSTDTSWPRNPGMSVKPNQELIKPGLERC